MGSEEKGSYQPWRHEAFMSDIRVRRMSPLCLKTYMLLLHEAFMCSTRPNLPDDDAELELMAYCSSREEWLSVRDCVLGMFTKSVVNGQNVLVNKRLAADWSKLQEIRDSRSEAGKASAEARKKATNLAKSNMCSTPVDTCQQERKKESMEESKESEVSESTDEDGQENMKIKNELQAVCAGFGIKPGGFKNTWDDVNALAKGHSVGAVVTDFTAWMEENQGDDFPRGPVSAYLYVAHDRLSADTAPATAILKDPEVVGLSRELSHVSGGVIAFVDKQRIRIGEVLKEFTAEEITAVFKTWLGDQDLNDAKNVSYLPGKFVQIMDNLCYSLRRSRLEKIKADADREAAKLRLQAEAQAELDAARKIAEDEQNSFDPLAELA